MKTLLFQHPDCSGHDTGAGHPERAARLDSVLEALRGELFAGLEWLEAPLGAEDLLVLAHGEEHVANILASLPSEPDAPSVRVDPDTVASPGLRQAVMRAVGAVCAGIDQVMAGDADNAFCATRPPGHHAEADKSMGFCLFNQVAIGAEYARQKLGVERVAVVDFDVHHGNGTQAIFWNQPDVFYGSTHQSPFYPGTGAVGETGVGNIFNAPLRAGNDGSHFRQAMNEVILPALDEFSPDLVLLSAGFDAHRDDPLASLNFVPEDFLWATGHLMEIADKRCNGRLVSVLEGGYDLDALADSAAAHVGMLMGRA